MKMWKVILNYLPSMRAAIASALLVGSFSFAMDNESSDAFLANEIEIADDSSVDADQLALENDIENFSLRLPAATPMVSPGAPAAPSAPEGSHQRKATLNFEDELVEGGTSKPELFYLFQKKTFNYKRMIKLRENFLPEMRRTTEDIQRVRGATI